jgi:hypothetical protein
MWDKIIAVLLKEITDNPDRVLSLIEKIVALLQAHPQLVEALVKAIPPAKP